MDIADRAQLEQDRAMARFEQARAAAAEVESATDCASCGYEIPEARRKGVPGVQTCIECQTLIERGVLRL